MMPHCFRYGLITLALAFGLASPSETVAQTDPRANRVAALLEPWNKADGPGAAVSVMLDGEVVVSVAVGSANLEHHVPITPQSVFHAASLSKQITAFAILLLEQDGKLSIDAPLARYLPEAAVLGPITLRQLLNHTSGLREQYTLLAAAGWRSEDLVTHRQVLALILAQRGSNAPPGTAYQYINSDYTLLAEVVGRVSGTTLNAFCKARIFDPLGMRHSRFQEDVSEVIPDRVESYRPVDGRYARAILSYATTGPTNLQTTAEDLGRWARNFETGEIGGASLFRRMEERGVLKDGTVNIYAMGQGHHHYRGFTAWMHGGRDAGFRTFLLRVPSEQLSVAVLGNVADFNSARIASAVAEIYLAGRPGYQPERTVDGLPTRTALRAYSGNYELFPGLIFTIGTDGRNLLFGALGDKHPSKLRALSLTAFELDPKAGITIEFPRPVGGNAPSLTYRAGLDGAIEALRIELAPFIADPTELQKFIGRYYSTELKVEYELVVEDATLVARSSRRPDILLHPYQRDTFSGSEWFFQQLKFDRDAPNRVTGFRLSGVYADGITFKRIEAAR